MRERVGFARDYKNNQFNAMDEQKNENEEVKENDQTEVPEVPAEEPVVPTTPIPSE